MDIIKQNNTPFKKISMVKKESVLFICTGNSCRSQIAEGLLRDMAGIFSMSIVLGVIRHGFILHL
ncbi:MAG: hypothetical protein Ct9H300mP2_0150 [Candidatus Neomarinimicrobiota bacterium]|nr:MAG: hypothetical protein Ct9H300mP2_0150 [Candidatus Neomarinimicrobiota bacterium]